jgi:hypothetical protein
MGERANHLQYVVLLPDAVAGCVSKKSGPLPMLFLPQNVPAFGPSTVILPCSAVSIHSWFKVITKWAEMEIDLLLINSKSPFTKRSTKLFFFLVRFLQERPRFEVSIDPRRVPHPQAGSLLQEKERPGTQLEIRIQYRFCYGCLKIACSELLWVIVRVYTPDVLTSQLTCLPSHLPLHFEYHDVAHFVHAHAVLITISFCTSCLPQEAKR